MFSLDLLFLLKLFSATIFLVAFVVSVYYNIKFAKIILKIEDALTESLDQLDEKYNNISKILEIPLFYDSPQIRQVVTDIRACRDSILYVANQISEIEESIDGIEEENP